MDDNTVLKFGAKKGMKLGDVSDGYLLTLYDAGKTSGTLKKYIEERIPVLRSRLQRKASGELKSQEQPKRSDIDR
jgi:hypothetical protein